MAIASRSGCSGSCISILAIPPEMGTADSAEITCYPRIKMPSLHTLRGHGGMVLYFMRMVLRRLDVFENGVGRQVHPFSPIDAGPRRVHLRIPEKAMLGFKHTEIRQG